MIGKLVKNAGKIALGTIVCLLLFEAAIRLVYRVRNSRVEVVPIPYLVRNTGLVPPWMDGLRILDRDDLMLFRGRPNGHLKYLDLFCPMSSEENRKAVLRRFWPSIPDEFKNKPTWEISLNSEGFRDLEFPTSKPAQTFRIVSLGDSWTLGHNANQNEAYPQRLRALLNTEFPNSKIEVLNLGMFTYTSHEGLQLLKNRVPSLAPDIVAIGYSMNDSVISGWRDKDVLVARPKHFRLKGFVTEHSELYRLMTYLGQLKKFESVSMTGQLKAVADPNEEFLYESWVSAEALEAKDYERLESRVRVSPPDYEKNIREMIKLVRAYGASPVLLHNELRPGSPYQAALRRISAEENVPLIDNCELLQAAKRKHEVELQEHLGLQPSFVDVGKSVTSNAGNVELVFRVNAGDQPVPTSMYIAGPYPQLGNATPNTMAMYDDGTHGDEKAGDHVWSFAATFSPGQKVFYVYTNSGAAGTWQNVDIPKVRSFVVPATLGRVYRPIETFGELDLQADGSHTNARGYELIAKAVRDVVVQMDRFKSFAGRYR